MPRQPSAQSAAATSAVPHQQVPPQRWHVSSRRRPESLMRRSQRLAERGSAGTKPQQGPKTPRIPCRRRTTMAATADVNAQASPKGPVTPPIPVQQADEPLLAFLKRLQFYSETTTAELSKWKEEEAARQQEIQRQLAEAEGARQQAAAEAAAAVQLQQQQVEASQNQVRYQATMELANEEATYQRLLQQQHFRANEEQEESTEDERNKEATTVLMENLLYTCNWQQRELLAIRQIFIRHETTFKTLDKKIATMQAELSTLHAANSQQQTINGQLQNDVSTGLAQLSAAASMGSEVADCSPALAAQAKQLEERINHMVASLGDISKFAGALTVSNQLQTLSDLVHQRPAAVAKEWKMPNFKIEKFDDYHKTDPLQWWMAFNAEADVHHTLALRRLDALYLQLIGGAQAFMTHMAVTLECTIATLHTKITWEEFEQKWKTRFMVNNDKRHALNNIFRMFQGQQPSREWLMEWQRLVATPELNLPFDAIRAEFFARSCDALTASLGSEFQYETFDDMISKARELIQVTTDASGYGIGAVLEHHDDTDWHPVEYFSRKVPPINTLDDAGKKELLAFVTVLKRWHHFLLGRRQFMWVTNNNLLTYYKTQDTVSSTIGRWMYFIDQFDFTSKHIPGSSNKAADALSRRLDLCALVHSTFGLDENLQQHVVNGYKSDPGFSTLYADLSADHPPTSNYRIVDNCVLLHTRGKDLLCVPQDRILRTRLLGEYHDSRLAGHLGVACTLA
ncbi:hypothetical protein CBR_g45568 [Chara braunii]|uniref:Reverse transcriptase RNase H-like domain-containing protein n=1 Tax=Chara braunii TaxID=69332 RepID=A0A388LZ74_CHABU|nr:hypothetical protein CBR_g45568 [Chara braunii]|eukprot:GBG87509.1 hypothetical protein CBR_g45568 [Chara braunii]